MRLQGFYKDFRPSLKPVPCKLALEVFLDRSFYKSNFVVAKERFFFRILKRLWYWTSKRGGNDMEAA